MTTIKIVLPPSADMENAIEGGLVKLTEAIAQRTPELVASGLLGGEFGYGARLENHVFSMSYYCWCEAADCPWCAGCNCYDNDWRDSGAQKAPEGEKCAWCRGDHRWAEKGALPPRDYPHLGAPNFWHRPSGLRVWWYKWIGRGMKMVGFEGVNVEAVVQECIESLP